MEGSSAGHGAWVVSGRDGSAHTVPRRSVEGRRGLLVVLTVVALVSVQHYREDIHPANEASRVYAAMAIANHGTPVLDPVFDRYFPGWRSAARPPNVDVASFQGRYHLDKAPGVSLLATPVIWVLGRTGILPSFPWIVWSLTAILIAVPSALFAGMAARRLTQAGLPEWPAWAVVLASPWLAYGGMLFGHALAAALVGAALLLGLGPLREVAGDPRSGSREAFLGGLAAGLATLVEYPAVFWALLGTTGIAASPCHRRRLPWFLLGGLPMVGVLLLWNAWNFGSPWALSYAFKNDPDLQAIHGQGAFGFVAPSWDRLVGICIGSRRGLLFVAPWLVIGLLGTGAAIGDQRLPRPWRIALVLGCWAWPLFVSGFVDWTAGMTYGPRHLLPGLPALALSSAVALRRFSGPWIRPIAGAWVLSSLLLNAVAAWTFPYVHPEVRNPLGEVLVPVLLQAGPAPMVWDVLLPRPLGALIPLASMGLVLAMALRPAAPTSPSPRISRTTILTLALACFSAHLGWALGIQGTAEESRAVLRTRALAFEMLERDDLARAARQALQAPPSRGGP